MLGTFSKLSTALVVASIGVITAPSALAASAQAGTPTDYAMTASGFATHLTGGDIPAGSGKTAFAAIGCTNQAGLSKTNKQASIPLQGLATVSAATTHTWTVTDGTTVSAWGTHKIAKVTFLDIAGLGTLSLQGIVSRAHSFHDGTGYHAVANTTLGSITLTFLGIPVNFPVPPAGQTLIIPGVAEISVGEGQTTVTADGASAKADAVTVKFIPTDTTVVIADSRSTISGDVRSALFEGSSTGASASAVGGVVKLGKTPTIGMPCRGTGGHVRSASVASADLGTVGSLGALSVSESAKKTANHANSWQEADVAGASLLGDTLVITGVVAKASASYVKGGEVVTSSEGTQVAEVTLNGTVIELPAQGTLEIAGIARFSTDVETQYTNGLKVTALRIELLGGSGVTINLATVKTVIKPSGL